VRVIPAVLAILAFEVLDEPGQHPANLFVITAESRSFVRRHISARQRDAQMRFAFFG
jgi:hypothetical protein